MTLVIHSTIWGQTTNEQANTLMINGVIKAKGVPVSGATITQKGSNIKTTTDSNGFFELHIPTSSKGKLIIINPEGNIRKRKIKFKHFKNSENIKIEYDISNRIMIFCCNNHNPKDCAKATDKEELKRLSKDKSCSF